MDLRIFPLLCELFKTKCPESHLSTPLFVTFVITTSPLLCRILSISCVLCRKYACFCSRLFAIRGSKICVRKGFFAPANGRVMTKMMTKNRATNGSSICIQLRNCPAIVTMVVHLQTALQAVVKHQHLCINSSLQISNRFVILTTE